MSQLQRIVITPAQFQQQQIVLTVQQQHYLTRVLRLRQGDRFIAMDGRGTWWMAALEETTAQIVAPITVQTELSVAVTLMVALPKGNGFDEVVRVCTELGVNCFVPVISDRTLLHPSPQKLERWRRIASEAAEQSERQIVPTILEPVPLSTGLLSVTGDRKYICVARGDLPHLLNCLPYHLASSPFQGGLGRSHPPSQGGLGGSLVIATGAEGGWTTNEVENAISSGFQPVSLGKRILRAVTAPIVAMSQISAVVEINENSGNSE